MEIYPRPGAYRQRTPPAPRPDDWVGRVEFSIALALQLAIAVVAVGALVRGQFSIGFAGLLILLLTFAPALIERRLNVQFPVEVTLITCLFLYASFFLGEIRGYYEIYWWWDLLLHGTSALLIGVVGFISIYAFYMTQRLQVAPVYVALFTFALAVTVGTLWEIFEFLMDHYFGFNMQRTGLVDTMTDLMLNAAGATLAAATAFLFVRNSGRLSARNLIRRYVASVLRQREQRGQ